MREKCSNLSSHLLQSKEQFCVAQSVVEVVPQMAIEGPWLRPLLTLIMHERMAHIFRFCKINIKILTVIAIQMTKYTGSNSK